jgi:hypothetical protein
MNLLDFTNTLLKNLIIIHLNSGDIVFLSRTCKRFRLLLWSYRILTIDHILYLLHHNYYKLYNQYITNYVVPDSWWDLNIQQRLLKYGSVNALNKLRDKNLFIDDYVTISNAVQYGTPKIIRYVVYNHLGKMDDSSEDLWVSKPDSSGTITKCSIFGKRSVYSPYIHDKIIRDAILSGKVENLLQILNFNHEKLPINKIIKYSIKSDSIPMIEHVIKTNKVKFPHLYKNQKFKLGNPIDSHNIYIRGSILCSSYKTINYVYSWIEENENINDYLQHNGHVLFRNAIDIDAYDGIQWLVYRGYYTINSCDIWYALYFEKYNVAKLLLRMNPTLIDDFLVKKACSYNYQPLEILLENGVNLTFKYIFCIKFFTTMMRLFGWSLVNPSYNALLVFIMLPFWLFHQISALLLIFFMFIVKGVLKFSTNINEIFLKLKKSIF